MNKRQARLFAIGSTVVAAVAFLGLTIDSHRQFPKLTNAQNITPQVTARQGCLAQEQLHQLPHLFGEGAYYAPDLTKIAQHRGAAYLQAYLKDPSKFYDEQRHRRLMPKQDMTDVEIADLVSFLDWVSKVDNKGWPPRPILVTGADDWSDGRRCRRTRWPPSRWRTPGSSPLAARHGQGSDRAGRDRVPDRDPGMRRLPLAVARRANGRAVAGGCGHTRPADRRIGRLHRARPRTQAAYLRESIVQPSAHVVAGCHVLGQRGVVHA